LLNIITVTLFSFFPISFILGNPSINLNIFFIDFLLLYNCYILKDWDWLKDKIFRLLIIFNFYLIINSIIFHYLTGYSNYDGLIRSFSFIKYIFLAYAFRLLIKDKIDLDKIIKNWLVIIGIIIIDVLFEITFGHNILGNISPDTTRIVSFFKGELVVGGLILCFGFLIATYFLDKDLDIKSKIFFNTFLIFIPLSIFISGERSNFIKSFIIFSVIVFLIDKTKLLINKKIFSIFFILTLFIPIFLMKVLELNKQRLLKEFLLLKIQKNLWIDLKT
jgi:hypothetical protein